MQLQPRACQAAVRAARGAQRRALGGYRGGGGGRGGGGYRGGGGFRDHRRGAGRREWRDERPEPKYQGTGRLAATGEHVYGAHPVGAALSRAMGGDGMRDELYGLYVQEGLEGDRAPLLEACESLGVPVHRGCPRHDLNMMADNRPHNGVVLDAAPLAPEFAPLLEPPAADAAGAPPPLWVVLDQVTDPQNLGAVMRSAHFFGATGVVVSTKNCAPLSPTASKASSGAMELLPLLACNSLPRFLRRTREEAETLGAPAWNVVGLSVADAAEDLGQRALRLPEDGAAIASDAASAPTIVCVGSEGHGLRTLVERECTSLAHIAGGAGTDRSLVDSLNASNAVAVLLYQVAAARK